MTRALPLLLLLSASAAAQAPDAERTLRAWFSGYEFVPGPEHFARLGDRLPDALQRIAADEASDPVVRARAVSAMVHVPNPAIERGLVELLEAPETPALLRRKAVRVLGEGFGPRHLDLVVSVFGAADDFRLREACADTLRGMGPAAYAIRDVLLRREPNPTVRAALRAPKDIPDPRRP